MVMNLVDLIGFKYESYNFFMNNEMYLFCWVIVPKEGTT